MTADHQGQTTVVTSDTPLDPSAIMRLATAYWESAALFAALDLNLFEPLVDGGKTASEIAAGIGADERGIERLLDGCCGLNILAKQGESYLLPSISRAFLVPGQPGYMGDALAWARDQYDTWGRLADSARTGKPAVEPKAHLGDDAAQTERYVLAMHNRALGVARGVIRHFDMDGVENLLDVGGGPGTYSMLLARQHPNLRATILDLTGVLPTTRRLIADAGLSDRVSTLEADATYADYGEDRYDAVLFSGVLHQMPESTIRRMLEGAHRALRAGGRVIVSDIMTDATHAQPLFATLFSLQMLLTSREGGVFAAEELERWLHDTGFSGVRIQRLPDPLPYTVLVGMR